MAVPLTGRLPRVLSCFLLLFSSCVKNNGKPVAPPGNIIITAIQPSLGPEGTIDTISGSGFDQIPDFDSLFLNGKQLLVESKSDSQIIVSIPKLAGSGPIVIWCGGKEILGPIFHYDSSWIVTTVAGSGQMAFADGQGLSASFYHPSAIAMDKNLNLFIGDAGCIRKVTPDGAVTTFAGACPITGIADGTGTNAQFSAQIWGLVFDSAGNLIATDGGNNNIRKITPDADVTTIVMGNRSTQGPLGPRPYSILNYPAGIVINEQGNMLEVDEGSGAIQMINAQDSVSTIFSGAGLLYNPIGCSLDSSGNLFVASQEAYQVIKVTPSGIATSIAGNFTPGYQNGQGANASFLSPVDVVVGRDQNIYVADAGIMIRRIDQQGNVTTFIPLGTGDVDGPVPYAAARGMFAFLFDPTGNIYFTDQINNNIRKISWQ